LGLKSLRRLFLCLFAGNLGLYFLRTIVIYPQLEQRALSYKV